MNSALISTILELDRHAPHYRVRMSPEEALEFAGQSEEYNAITNDSLVRLIERANEAIPPMNFGPTNQNTGRPHHHFSIGNEGSRVIYCEIDPWYLGNGFSVDNLAWYLVAIGHQASASESDVVQNDTSRLIVRWWWD